MFYISNSTAIPDEELEFNAVRSQGAGGQNVNKVATAIHLRFDIKASSLPETYKERLLRYRDQRISKEGVIVIKAQRFRSQEKNREDAVDRLRLLIQQAMQTNKARRPTAPSKSAKRKRVDQKTQRGSTKALRGKVDF